jgi:hypothetical protein
MFFSLTTLVLTGILVFSSSFLALIALICKDGWRASLFAGLAIYIGAIGACFGMIPGPEGYSLALFLGFPGLSIGSRGLNSLLKDYGLPQKTSDSG